MYLKKFVYFNCVQDKAFISNYTLILFDKELSLEVKDGDKTVGRPEEHEEDESKALISDLSDLTSASTSRRQLDAGTLDAKVVKALKKQEEKREKRTLRKKEVNIIIWFNCFFSQI